MQASPPGHPLWSSSIVTRLVGLRRSLVRPCSSYEQAKVPLLSVIDVSPGSIVGPIGPETASPVVLPASTGPIAVRGSTELILEKVKSGKPSRLRAARLVGNGSRFQDSDRTIGVRELFFFRLFSGSGKIQGDVDDEWTRVEEKDAVKEFSYWVDIGLLTFNPRKDSRNHDSEEDHKEHAKRKRITQNWDGFVGQIRKILPQLGPRFKYFRRTATTPKYYALHLAPGAIEDRLGDVEALSKTIMARPGRG
jgi:hypothetical protein